MITVILIEIIIIIIIIIIITMTLKYAGWRLEGNSHFLWVGEVLFSLAWQSPRDGVSVPYNLVFSFNVDPGFFLHNIGEICTMLS